jgi:hypothetical protein
LLANLLKANLRGIGGGGRAVDCHCNSVQQLQRSGLGLLAPLTFRDIFERGTDAVAEKGKAVEPKHSFWEAGICVSHFTDGFRYTGNDDRAAAVWKLGI